MTGFLHGKKGIEKEMLIILIVGLGFIIANLFINRDIAEAGGDSADFAACKSSVEKNARLHINGIELPASVNCPARTAVIGKLDSERDVERSNKQVADSMYECWAQYGQGRLNLFSDEGTFCAVCSFVDITADKPLTGLAGYLLGNNIPDGRDILYADYLTGYNTPRAKDIATEITESKPEYLDEAAESHLDAETLYAVVFVYAKGKDEIRVAANNLLGLTPAGEVALKGSIAVGAFAGATTFVGLATMGFATGPVGWIALGVGAASFGIAQVAGFFLSPDNYPEWISFLTIMEWNADKTASILTDDLECDYFPANLD